MSHKLFARAGRPFDQYAYIGRGNPAKHPESALHRMASAFDPFKYKIIGHRGIPSFRRDGLGHHQPELIDVDRLDDIVIGALLNGLFTRIDSGISRNKDDLGGRIFSLGLDQYIDTVGVAAHIQVRDDKIEILLRNSIESVFGSVNGNGFGAMILQRFDQDIGVVFFIVDYQYYGIGIHYSPSTFSKGRVIVNEVPLPGCEFTVIEPLWASMIFLAVGSPSPEPPGLEV